MLVASELHAMYQVLRRGVFVHNAFIAALPFSSDSRLWEDLAVSAKKEEARAQAGDGHRGERDNWKTRAREAELISYREYTDRWSEGRVKRAGLFEKMLLVGCQGRRVVEKRLREVQRGQSLEQEDKDEVG